MLSALQRQRMTEPFPEFQDPVERIGLAPNRTGGLHRLGRFASRTGRHYARTRNHDFGAERRSNVSALLPWLQHRLVSERKVPAQGLTSQSVSAAEKFIPNEVRRGYFEDCLEQRPSLWTAYQCDWLASFESLERDPSKNGRFRDAIAGNAVTTQKRVIRPYDPLTSPHATAGFWGLKKTTPTILWDLNLTQAEGTPHG